MLYLFARIYSLSTFYSRNDAHGTTRTRHNKFVQLLNVQTKYSQWEGAQQELRVRASTKLK